MTEFKNRELQLVLDLGAPPIPGRDNKPFSILIGLGAANGSRVAITGDICSATDNVLATMDQIEASWQAGDFSLAYVVFWVFPECGLYLSYCQRLGVDPEKHLLEILERARELNARHGAWRVTLQLRGELDSCFIDFPADWSTREKCYANWERFNLTELHFARYKRYGYPPCYGNLTETYPVKDLLTFFTRHGLHLRDYPVDVCCNRGYDVHHNFRWGWPSVSIETMCGSTWNSHLLVAACRGGAKEYGARWGYDVSPWDCMVSPFETMYRRDGRWCGGLSDSLLLRSWMMGYLAGANLLVCEATDRTHFVLDGEPDRNLNNAWGGTMNKRTANDAGDLSPVGRKGVEFGRYVRERHPDRGTPFVPMALVVQGKNGWNTAYSTGGDDVPRPGPDPHFPPYQVWFGKIESTPAEWMIGAFYRAAFEAEPITGLRMDLWREFENPDKYQFISQGRIPIEKAEEGIYLGRTRWGDTMDVFDEYVRAETLSEYPLVVLLGIMPEDDAFWVALEGYVKNGGVVVANLCQIPKAHQHFFGASWEAAAMAGDVVASVAKFESVDGQPWRSREQIRTSVYVSDRGRGRAYLTVRPWAVQSPYDLDQEMVRLIDALHAQVCPVRVSGEPVHWLVNKLNAGWLVSVFNHHETLWRGEISVRDCSGQSEQWTDMPLPANEPGGAVPVEVPPYEFRIFRFAASDRQARIGIGS